MGSWEQPHDDDDDEEEEEACESYNHGDGGAT